MKDITLKLSGSITIGKGDVQLRDEIKGALTEGYRIIILDFEEINYMDSSGVGELAAGLMRVKRHGGQLALTKLGPKIKQLLSIMAFLDSFPTFDSNQEAVEVLRREFE